MEVDHELVEVGEFDALSIEVKPHPGSVAGTGGTRAPFSVAQHPLDAELEGTGAKYPAKEHARRVAKELGAEDGLIYLSGQKSETFEDSDMSPEFRQRRYFYYLSGADFANCSATYEIAHDCLILWIPYTDPRQVLWYGSTPGIDECKRRLHVDDVRYASGLAPHLHHYFKLHPRSTLFALHRDHTPKMDGVPPRGIVFVDVARLQPAMDAARVVKTDYEVAMIRRANAVSSAAHRAVLERLRELTNERHIEAIFRGFCLARGASHQAYPVIAGSGPNAATLHYEDNNQALAGRQLIVLDAGAEWHCYASDITRTLPAGPDGRFSDEAAAVYGIVETMQEECIARIRPGLAFYALHLHASAVAAAGLLRLGVLRGGSVAEVLSQGTVAAFFPHGLGHHVGLEVHDVSGPERLMMAMTGGDAAASTAGRPGTNKGRGKNKREWVTPAMLTAICRDIVFAAGTDASSADDPYKGRQKLQKNMIVTVEPGIYFCREYIESYFLNHPAHARYIDKAVLEKYYPVGGVRIEDDILVTEDGYENLTTAPKGEEALKIIRGEID